MVNLRVLPRTWTIDRLKKNKDFVSPLTKMVSQKTEVGIFVNRRKIKMQKIYQNLLKELRNYNAGLKTYNIDQTYRGFVTNYKSTGYTEMDLAVVILTKKHSDKEKLIIEELRRSLIPTVVVSLCEDYCEKDIELYLVYDTRGLYHFMYMLALNNRQELSYVQFSKQYQTPDYSKIYPDGKLRTTL